ncbi:hypothetical protein EUX98_g4941 [Antrodiella citrinella]|uniref:glutathione transferase n=1 Tax=Antrodiella citrinella TaxID=2447956 RepID=A0A4S4MUK3_9APHY|nr:hypothetical protein EUX98_g4941 [Antrodiella citrinella]
MITVHHLNNSRSQRILWLLEELELPYEIKKYQRSQEGIAPPELSNIHPLGLAPIVTDGDLTLAESGAIVEYIVQKYGRSKVQPPDSGKIHDLYFKHYAEGTLMPILVNKLVFSIVPERSPFFIRPIARMMFGALTAKLVTPRLLAHAAYLEKHLEQDDKQWFAGGEEPTIADYMMSFPMDGWADGMPEAFGPNLKAYVKRMHDRPAYQRALKQGGEYAYAKPSL